MVLTLQLASLSANVETISAKLEHDQEDQHMNSTQPDVEQCLARVQEIAGDLFHRSAETHQVFCSRYVGPEHS